MRAIRDALGDLLGWAFHGVVDFLWPPKKDDDTNKDGEAPS